MYMVMAVATKQLGRFSFPTASLKSSSFRLWLSNHGRHPSFQPKSEIFDRAVLRPYHVYRVTENNCTKLPTRLCKEVYPTGSERLCN